MSFLARAAPPPPPPPDFLMTPSPSPTLAIISSVLSLSTSTPTPSSLVSVSSSFGDDNDSKDGECNLVGNFSILVQGALGALALLSLVYKRWRERPQRPVKIWAFDVSKQVVGSILLHLLNLLMSELSSGAMGFVAAAAKGAQGAAEIAAASAATDDGDVSIQPTDGARLALRTLSNMLVRAAAEGASDGQVSASELPRGAQNPCSFYLLNLAIDTTLGIPILITLLRLVTAAARRTALARPPESIESGNYGQGRGRVHTGWWLKQCLIYFVGLLGMKMCVFFLFELMPWLGAVGDWALRWTEGNQQLQIFFVMFFFPLVMNAMQYYIIDGFIKDQKKPGDGNGADAAGYEGVGQEEDGEEDGDDRDDDDDDDEEIGRDSDSEDLLGRDSDSETRKDTRRDRRGERDGDSTEVEDIEVGKIADELLEERTVR